MNKTKQTSLFFGVIGILVILYSFLIKSYFENLDLGKRFNAGEFRESDLYIWIGIIWLFLGLVYYLFYQIDKIQLSDKLSKRHFWFTLFFIIELIAVPIQNRFYPTDLYRGTILMNILDIYLAISFILFLVGLYSFLMNLIKSTYSYFLIKKGWK